MVQFLVKNNGTKEKKISGGALMRLLIALFIYTILNIKKLLGHKKTGMHA
jgi:hypothetical protein